MENRNGLFKIHEDTRSGILADLDIPSRVISAASDTKTLLVKMTDGSILEVADTQTTQPKNSTLDALSGKPTTTFGIGVLNVADAAAARAYIGAGTSSFDGAYGSLSSIPAPIAAIDDLVPAADKLPYFTGASAAALATLTATGRNIIASADAATARTALGAGTVSSVGLTLPSIFTVTGSPVTGSGTLAATLASQAANLVFASPAGATGAPAMIALAASHIPNLDWAKITTGKPTTLAGYGITDAVSNVGTTAYGRGVLAVANAAAARTYIGAGTSSFDGAYGSLSSIPAPIAAIDDLVPAADKLPYFTGASAAALATLTATGRNIIASADAATARTALGAGTVSSVGLTLPSIFTVTGSPVTGSGTLAATLASQAANLVFASPAGAAGAPAMIALAASHIPNLDWTKIATGKPTTLAGYGITDAQPMNADLTAIAALTGTGVPRRTGTNTWDQVTLTGWATKAYTNGSTTDVAEGTNFYYTDARARAAFSGSAPISVSGAGVVSHSTADGYRHVPTTGTTNNGKFLKSGATAGSESWQTLVVEDLPSHGSTHEFGGTDAIAGQSLSGLRTTDSPEFNRVYIGSELRLKNTGVQEWGLLASSYGLELAARNPDWSAIDWPITIGHNAGGVIRLGGTTSRPVNLTHSLQIGGVEVVSSGRQAEFDKLTIRKALGTAIGTASRVELINADATWGGATWMDSGANMRMAFFQNDATWTDRYVFGRNGNLNILSGSLQMGGTDTITSGREGRFTGLRLTNLSAGQIPVASDANGQIAASGLTDDGTFLGISRIIRAWSSMARSGNTWTDLQWTQDAQERVSIFSSNGAGAGAYHNVTLVPADTEATGRGLGVIQYAQKVSGKSGTNPGLKAAILADSVGAGGTVGGFGGKLRIRYRPDNGNDLVDALRVGAFDGSTADAVETAILLRALAGINVNAITVTGLSSGMVKSSGGTLTNATANTDYLPVNSPAMTGIATYQRQQTGITTISTSAPFALSVQTNQFINITYNGMATCRLYSPGADITGIVYKIHCKGCTSLKFLLDTAGSLYYLNNAGGASNYWYQQTGTEHTFNTNANENKTCDVWTDGTVWYVKW